MFVTSILDTDLYKLTMQRAVLERLPGLDGNEGDPHVCYRFTNRSGTKFSKEMFDVVYKAVQGATDFFMLYLGLIRAEFLELDSTG